MIQPTNEPVWIGYVVQWLVTVAVILVPDRYISSEAKAAILAATGAMLAGVTRGRVMPNHQVDARVAERVAAACTPEVLHEEIEMERVEMPMKEPKA
jgi:hypothetical protein